MGMNQIQRESARFLGRLSLWLAFSLAFHTTALADTGRPNREAGPTKVTVAAIILDINRINGADQTFDANFFYMLSWSDPRLAHDQERKSMPLNEVWHPRIQILNQQKVWPTFPEVVSIAPDGQVVYRQRVWGTFSQPLNLRDFPFDRQNLSIQLVTAGYTPNDLEIVIDPRSQMSERLSLPDWDIVEWSVDATTIKPIPNLPIELAGVVFSFQAERREQYFIYQVIVPLILIVAMSWIVFWIDPKESGTQIYVAITTMLTLIAYRLAVGRDLPKVDYMTRLDFFILGATVLIYATLLQAVITTSMAKSGKLFEAREIDLWCRWLFPGGFIVLALESLWLRLIL
jgi:hypothetical protein